MNWPFERYLEGVPTMTTLRPPHVVLACLFLGLLATAVIVFGLAKGQEGQRQDNADGQRTEIRRKTRPPATLLSAPFTESDIASTPAPQIGNGPAWSAWRGNAAQTGVANSDLSADLDIRWKFQAKDAIEGTAAIRDGVVYIGSMDEHLYALDLATGKEKWKYKAGAPIKASPGVDADAVYIGDGDGIFHSVDRKTGNLRWKFQTGGEIVSGANFAGDNVIFGSYDETLYCLSRAGRQIWTFKAQGPVNGSPAVIGERTFVAGCDSTLHILDTASGKEVASVDLEGQSGASAAVAGDALYVGTMGSQFKAIDWKKAAVLWTFEDPDSPREFYSSAAITDKLILVGCRDKRLHAFDRVSGGKVWSFATPGRVDSSAVVAGGRVFVGTLGGRVRAGDGGADIVRPGGLLVLDLAKGTELKRYDLDGNVQASPAVVERSLVIGTMKGTVYCFGEKK